MPRKKAENPKFKARVALIDDHPIVRRGVATLISQQPDLEVCGEAESADEAMELIERTRPDLAVVDLGLKDSSGLDLIKDMRIRCPDVKVLVLTMRDESFYAERVLRAGARGFLTKDEGAGRLVEGLRRILDGDIFVSDRLAARFLNKLAGRQNVAESPMDSLTDRELQVLEMIGSGLPTREIAERLHISVKTVESHREHLKEKLRLDNATELLKHAIQWVQGKQGS